MSAPEAAPKNPKLIHIATVFEGGKKSYLFLRQHSEERYIWSREEGGQEHETSVEGPTSEEALRKARKHWARQGYLPLGCGFRYSLPERDEHGINALFHQMAASYASSNGVYFDPELGHNCIVQQASQEARRLHQRLQSEGRL